MVLGAETIFIVDLLAIFAIYVIVNLSLNLEFGYTGIPNFGKVLAVGAGAFVAASIPGRIFASLAGIEGDYIANNLAIVSELNIWLVDNIGIGFVVFFLTLGIAAGVGGGIGLLTSYPAIRLRGDYLAITLLAFGESIRIIGNNFTPLVGGTLGFGGFIIDEISSVNDFPTQTFETGVPFELRFPFSEDNGADAIDHVAVYVLHEGDETTYDSDLYLIYDRYEPLETFDSNGYISNFTVNIVEKSPVQVDMIFGITFALPMEPSDIIVRAWDYHRRTIDYKFNQLIQVVESDSNNELIANTDLTSWNSPTNDNSIIDSSTILRYDFQSKSTNNDSGEVSEYNTLAIPLWIKFNANWWSQEEIGDDDFVAGIKYLIERDIIIIPELVQVHHEGVKEIPSWIKYNAEWWAGDLVSDEEFVRTIQWLIQEGVMKV